MMPFILGGCGAVLLILGFGLGWAAASKTASDEVSAALEQLGWNAKARDVWKRIQANREGRS